MAETKIAWISGFCGTKSHEGTKPKSYSGKPLKTCPFTSDDCACRCHKDLDMMFEMAGMERVPQENPEYHPDPKIEEIRKCLEEIHNERILRVTTSDAPVRIESIAPGELPPTAIKEFTETESGRKQRGQLEDEVKKATDMWVMLKATQPCTPVWVAEMIDAQNPPSTGAVNAVFERWRSIGFATVEKKPTRFTGYTPDGIQHGLHAMKARAKTAQRSAARSASMAPRR